MFGRSLVAAALVLCVSTVSAQTVSVLPYPLLFLTAVSSPTITLFTSVASERFERCVATSVIAPVDQAIADSCTTSPAHRPKVRQALSSKAVRRQLSVRLGLAANDAPCEKSAATLAPEMAALCALSSDEHLLLSSPDRVQATGRRRAHYRPMVISIAGVERYAHWAQQAAHDGGFQRLASLLEEHSLTVTHPDEPQEVNRLRHQAELLAQTLERADSVRRVAFSSEQMTDERFELLLFSEMQEAARASLGEQAQPRWNREWGEDLPRQWATDAAIDLRNRSRQAIAMAGTDVGGTSSASETVQAYVAQLVFGLIERAGRCAIACQLIPTLPTSTPQPGLTSDLSMALEIRP
jgi:hypothetical protein